MHDVEKYREEVLQHGGVSLLMMITNLCQREESVLEEATRTIRSVCSLGRSIFWGNFAYLIETSLQTIMKHDLVATIIMTMSSYLQNVPICTHCIRSIEWILAAGKKTVCKALWDEGVFPIACDLLKNHVDSTLIGYICSMLSKLIRMSDYDAHCISEIQASGLILLIENSIQQNFKSESTLSSLLNLLAVLVSNRIF